MNHTNALHRTSRRALKGMGIGALLLATSGCTETEAPGIAENGAVGETQQPYSAYSVYIVNGTNASLTNLTISFEAQGGSTHVFDTERVKGTLYARNVSPKNRSLMQVTREATNTLRETYFGQGNEPAFPDYSLIRIDDYSYPTFPLGKIKINGYVNGECFEDWEVIDWQTPDLLYINVTGGWMKDGCKIGNFLRPFP